MYQNLLQITHKIFELLSCVSRSCLSLTLALSVSLSLSPSLLLSLTPCECVCLGVFVQIVAERFVCLDSARLLQLKCMFNFSWQSVRRSTSLESCSHSLRFRLAKWIWIRIQMWIRVKSWIHIRIRIIARVCCHCVFFYFDKINISCSFDFICFNRLR